MPRVTIEVIVGTMFSGKTQELQRRLSCLKYAHRTHLAFKPATDTLSGDHCITTHDGQKMPGIIIADPHQIIQAVEAQDHVDVVGIDEMQFLDPSLVQVARTLIRRGISVIASGLDMDFRGMPFRTSADMMAIADSVSKIRSALCSCGERAVMSQRISDGQLASADSPTEAVGDEKMYEARCRACYIFPE